VAYQGAGRALDTAQIRELSLFAVEGLLPNLTVLLDLEASAAMARRKQTGAEPDRLEREKVEFFEAVRRQYLDLAAAEPKRWMVLDATHSREELQVAIRKRVSELLGEE
jgi:dTMP kinase